MRHRKIALHSSRKYNICAFFDVLDQIVGQIQRWRSKLSSVDAEIGTGGLEIVVFEFRVLLLCSAVEDRSEVFFEGMRIKIEIR